VAEQKEGHSVHIMTRSYGYIAQVVAGTVVGVGRFALWTVGEIVDGGVSGITEGRIGYNLDILVECGVLDISEVTLRGSQRCPHSWDEV